MSSLRIDLHFKRADYLKFYGDATNSIKDYLKVIEICEFYNEEKFGEDYFYNQKVKESAQFSLAKLYFDIRKP